MSALICITRMQGKEIGMAHEVIVTYQGQMQCVATRPADASTLKIGPSSGPGFGVYHLWGAGIGS